MHRAWSGGRPTNIDRPHFDESRFYELGVNNRLQIISNINPNETDNEAQIGKIAYEYHLNSFGNDPAQPGNSLTQAYNIDGQMETKHDGTQLEWDASGRMKLANNGNDTYTYGCIASVEGC